MVFLRRVLAIGVVIACGLFGVSPPAAVGAVATSDVIVLLAPSVADPGALAGEHAAKHDGTVRGVYRHALKGYAATVPTAAIPLLKALPFVQAVDLDGKVYGLETQGAWAAFDASSTLAQSIPTGVRRVNADKNANLDIDGVDDSRMDVDIAITDSGVDIDHPDLNVASRADCTSGTCRDNQGVDDNGHGTHVAGTAAAIDNGIGVVGVAPGARIHAVKVLGADNSGQWSWIVAGYDYIAARSSTIEVVNSSIGGSGEPAALQTAVRNLVGRGVALSVSAGNSNARANTSAPAKYAEVMTVSALADFNGQPGGGAASTCRADQDDTTADFSNYGTEIEIIAPGVCINSTFPDNTYNPNYSGTSMAAPHVAGALALVAMVDKPTNQTEVMALYDYVASRGNANWTDEKNDGEKEPLLDVGDANSFPPSQDGNRRPTASYTFTCADATLRCDFDGSASSDPDGSISSYAWNFGDGSTGTGARVSHTYARGGSYTVTLTVTDNQSATGSTNKSVRVGPNQAPTAAFTADCRAVISVRFCKFNAAGSSDPDGSISSYAWNFGDGSTGTGVQADHIYSRAGRYTVTLTVTDDQGVTDTETKTVTVP